MAVIDDTGSYTYAELADASQRVALNLLDLGLQPGDRVVLQLPNTRFFASLYFGLQRIGVIPIMALPSHRYRELCQFVGLSGAVAAAAPATAGETDFAELHRRVSAEHPALRLSILQGGAPGRIGLEELHERRPARHSPADLARIAAGIDPNQRSFSPDGFYRSGDLMWRHPSGNYVYWELSGWAPKHFPASLRTDIRGRLQDKIMFGSDYPSLPLSRLLREWDELGFSEEVMDKVFHANAERVLGLPLAGKEL